MGVGTAGLFVSRMRWRVPLTLRTWAAGGRTLTLFLNILPEAQQLLFTHLLHIQPINVVGK